MSRNKRTCYTEVFYVFFPSLVDLMQHIRQKILVMFCEDKKQE